MIHTSSSHGQNDSRTLHVSRLSVVVCLLATFGCYNSSAAPITDVVGTWGGDNAGLIVGDNTAHVHIGCTLGDTDESIRPDAYGQFDVVGKYNVDAFPIDRGITHPARFTGKVVGQTMTLTVTLTDTPRTMGPVTLVYGKEPKMGPCPICRTPKQRAAANAKLNKEPTWQKTFTRL